jgi:hypothetical protein
MSTATQSLPNRSSESTHLDSRESVAARSTGDGGDERPAWAVATQALASAVRATGHPQVAVGSNGDARGVGDGIKLAQKCAAVCKYLGVGVGARVQNSEFPKLTEGRVVLSAGSRRTPGVPRTRQLAGHAEQQTPALLVKMTARLGG